MKFIRDIGVVITAGLAFVWAVFAKGKKEGINTHNQKVQQERAQNAQTRRDIEKQVENRPVINGVKSRDGLRGKIEPRNK